MSCTESASVLFDDVCLALILVRPGRVGHGRLGTSAADVSSKRNLSQARISCGPSSATGL